MITSTFFHNHANLREISFKKNFAAGCEIVPVDE